VPPSAGRPPPPTQPSVAFAQQPVRRNPPPASKPPSAESRKFAPKRSARASTQPSALKAFPLRVTGRQPFLQSKKSAKKRLRSVRNRVRLDLLDYMEPVQRQTAKAWRRMSSTTKYEPRAPKPLCREYAGYRVRVSTSRELRVNLDPLSGTGSRKSPFSLMGPHRRGPPPPLRRIVSRKAPKAQLCAAGKSLYPPTARRLDRPPPRDLAIVGPVPSRVGQNNLS